MLKPLLALPLFVLLAGCTGTTTTTSTTAATGSGRSVEVEDNVFHDGNLTLSKGSAVAYKNEGERAHTVTVHWVGEPATTLRLDRTLQPGESVSFTFMDAGTYHVWCRFHGSMTAGMASVVKAE